MNRAEPYDDPILASRVRSWMETAAPAAAPERLVFSVMDDVERRTRRHPWRSSRPIFASALRYAALTLVISIGVAGGIILTRGLPSVGGPTAPPSPSAPIPSLRSIGGFDTNGRILAGGQGGGWLATASGELVPIDSSTAGLGDPVQIGFVPSDVAVSVAAGTGGRETVWLVAPDSSLMRLDPFVGELFGARGATGSRIALGAGAAWVGRADAVQRVDLDQLTDLGTFDIHGHRATDPLVAVGSELWVADAPGIDRLDTSSGALGTRIPVTATSLVVARGLVWAAERASLVAIDPGSGDIVRTAALPPDVATIVAVETHGDTLWLAASGPSGPLLVGVDPTSGRATTRTQLATPAVSIAVVGNQVWTLDAGGHVDRYAPSL